MKTSLLLSNRYKPIGLMILVPSVILGFFWRFFEFQFGFLDFPLNRISNNAFKDLSINFTDELALIGIITGLLLIAFSREKEEDEFIGSIRLGSLQWAVLINYLLLMIAALIVHGMPFMDVMMYDMLTILIIFIIRFHVLLYRQNHSPEQN